MLTLSPECQKVVDSVRLLAGHGAPSMFLIDISNRTGFSTEYINNRLKDWIMERSMINGRRIILADILQAALDIQSESAHGVKWEELCGIDHKHQIKLLAGEL